MMGKKRKALPHWVTGICRKDSAGNIFDRYGDMVVNDWNHKRKIVNGNNKKPYWYCDIDGVELVFYEIGADELHFYGEETGRVHLDQYDELCGDPGVDVSDMDYAVHTDAIREFLMPVFIRQPFYVECSKDKDMARMVNAGNVTNVALLHIFLEKKHKTLQLLFNEGYLSYYVTDILKDKSAGYEKLNKKHLELAARYKVKLGNIINMCSKYNPQEVDRFCEMLEYFHFDVFSTLEYIDEQIHIEDFSAFANYILRNILSGGISIVLNGIGWDSEFFREYRDYVYMVTEEEYCDLYPENLEEAHKAAVDRACFFSDGNSYNILDFKKAANAYADLAWDNGEGIKVIVPSSPKDLFDEGAAMHNCVRTYINSVILGRTKILFFRKNRENYMTVEVKDNQIVQAKRKFNENPTLDDKKILEEYAAVKGLTIKLGPIC